MRCMDPTIDFSWKISLCFAFLTRGSYCINLFVKALKRVLYEKFYKTCRPVLCKSFIMFILYKIENISFVRFLQGTKVTRGFPGGASDKESTCQCRRLERCGFDSYVGKTPWSRKWQPTPVFVPGKFHGQRSLAGYSPWCHRVRQDSAIEHPHTHKHTHKMLSNQDKHFNKLL